MKILIVLASLFVSLNVFAARIEVDVLGMTCGMCVEAITNELNATQKVENVKVKIDDKKAYFDEVKGKKVTDAEIKAAIKKAGYEAVKVRRY